MKILWSALLHRATIITLVVAWATTITQPSGRRQCTIQSRATLQASVADDFRSRLTCSLAPHSIGLVNRVSCRGAISATKSSSSVPRGPGQLASGQLRSLPGSKQDLVIVKESSKYHDSGVTAASSKAFKVQKLAQLRSCNASPTLRIRLLSYPISQTAP